MMMALKIYKLKCFPAEMLSLSQAMRVRKNQDHVGRLLIWRIRKLWDLEVLKEKVKV